MFLSKSGPINRLRAHIRKLRYKLLSMSVRYIICLLTCNIKKKFNLGETMNEVVVHDIGFGSNDRVSRHNLKKPIKTSIYNLTTIHPSFLSKRQSREK